MSASSEARAHASRQAKFVTGSTMRHVVVMTTTGSIGLISIFIVDALNLFYISLLGVQELAAAVGFASAVMFFTVSVAIGFTIATSALVSRALGGGTREQAAAMGGAATVISFVAVALLCLSIWPFLHGIRAVLGARGETLELATRFMRIVLPSTPIIAVGMAMTGILRGVGDARRAMYVTLASGLASAILDPLFIFGFGLGLDGAAIATVLSRCVMIAVGFHGAHTVHRLVALPDYRRLKAAWRPFFAIGFPAVLTQVATPVGNAYVTLEIASFGDEAVAGWAIIGRLMPVAFGAVFALSGAVGPILGQNYGAGRYDRLGLIMRDSLIVILVYVLAAWGLLALFREGIADLFGARATARELVVFFCLYVAGSFVFNGAMFVANAAFNNLGFPTYSTVFNWGRATLGTVPFVSVGAMVYGAEGVLIGWGLGAVLFGLASLIVCFRVVRRMGARPPPSDPLPGPPPAAHSPFSTGKASTAG